MTARRPSTAKLRQKSRVIGFADLAWRIYDGNASVKHLITILAIALTIIVTGWLNHASTVSHIDSRFDTLAAQRGHQ